ncbi:unnamed protein product, partial [marine sediment metagenome]
TNFEIIKKRIEYFKDLEKKKAEGELEKYSKKEKAKIDRELRNLKLKFGGIKNLEKLPDAIFVLDMKKDAAAVKEAKMKGIKVIGLADTNVDPTLADFPIPANDDALSSVKYILDKVKAITGKAADPWNIKDAFLASALYLADYGAAQQTYNAEWRAAMIYFSGTTNTKYRFYGDSVMKIASQYEEDIKTIESGS